MPVEVTPTFEVIEIIPDPIEVIEVALQGLPGAEAQAFTHDQIGDPQAEWIVNHNLGYEPNVQVRDVTGNIVITDMRHINVNQLRLYFAVPTEGKARCI